MQNSQLKKNWQGQKREERKEGKKDIHYIYMYTVFNAHMIKPYEIHIYSARALVLTFHLDVDVLSYTRNKIDIN